MSSKLIITLKIEDKFQSFFEEKRKSFFPKHCNYVSAHLTFFHAAPNSNIFIDSLREVAAPAAIMMKSEMLIPFKNGMAYAATNEYLQTSHANLQALFFKELAGKDKKLWNPHITIQNKVTAFKAHKSYKELLPNFEPFSFKVEGFNGYVYAKKKWDFSFFIPFAKL